MREQTLRGREDETQNFSLSGQFIVNKLRQKADVV